MGDAFGVYGTINHAHIPVVIKREGTKPPDRPGYRWRGKIKNEPQIKKLDVADWTNLARATFQWYDGKATISLPTKLNAPLIILFIFLSLYFSGINRAFFVFPFSLKQTFEGKSFVRFDSLIV
jgi:hypothetical protein